MYSSPSKAITISDNKGIDDLITSLTYWLPLLLNMNALYLLYNIALLVIDHPIDILTIPYYWQPFTYWLPVIGYPLPIDYLLLTYQLLTTLYLLLTITTCQLPFTHYQVINLPVFYLLCVPSSILHSTNSVLMPSHLILWHYNSRRWPISGSLMLLMIMHAHDNMLHQTRRLYPLTKWLVNATLIPRRWQMNRGRAFPAQNIPEWQTWLNGKLAS